MREFEVDGGHTMASACLVNCSIIPLSSWSSFWGPARHCAYWLPRQGQPPLPNTTSATVHIPITNVFGSEQLAVLMEKVERGESV